MVLVHARHPALTNTLVARVLAVMSGIRQEISELIFSWQQHPTQKFANRVLHPSLQLQACTFASEELCKIKRRVVFVHIGIGV